VTDQNGLSDTSGLQIEVIEQEVPQQPPTAVIEGPGQAAVGQEVTFQGGNSTPGSSAITGYSWDFGNGQTASGPAASTVYDTPGDYQVSLTVSDENGLSGSASLQISIQAGQGGLEGPTWVLQGSLPDTQINALFDGATVSGSSGCNSYSGSVEAGETATAFAVGPLMSTSEACPPEIMNLEQRYTAALQRAGTWGFRFRRLVIHYGAGKDFGSLVFEGREPSKK
jgi:heat shock protein HslJ